VAVAAAVVVVVVVAAAVVVYDRHQCINIMNFNKIRLLRPFEFQTNLCALPLLKTVYHLVARFPPVTEIMRLPTPDMLTVGALGSVASDKKVYIKRLITLHIISVVL
jgi:hypothetical protein